MISMSGSVTDCPRCGATARFADGIFSEYGRGRLEIISGPAETREIFQQLYGVAQKARSGEISKQEAINQARAIDPRLGGIVERFLLLGLPALAVLASLIGVYLQFQGNRSTAEFEREALRLLERQTLAIEQMILSSGSQNEVQPDLDREGHDPAKPKADPEPMPPGRLAKGHSEGPKVAIHPKDSKRRRRRLSGRSPRR